MSNSSGDSSWYLNCSLGIVNPARSLVRRTITLTSVGGIGGIVGLFHFFGIVPGTVVVYFTLVVNIARWGFLCGCVPGFLLGIASRTNVVSCLLTEKLGYLAAIAFLTGLLIAIGTVWTLLAVTGDWP